MKNIEEIKKDLESDFSGGRIEIEGGLRITKEEYSDQYEVYHNSYVRGGNYAITTIKDDEGFEEILQKHEEYLENKKELEDQGYELMGKDLYFKDDKEEKLEAHLQWGEKIYYKEEG